MTILFSLCAPIDTASEKGWNEEVVDLKIGGDKSGMTGSHGGGDLRLVEDFVHVLQGEEPSISCTTIKDSINGHLGSSAQSVLARRAPS